jgi:hypothetical protein
MKNINVHMTGSLMSNMAYCATFEGYDGAEDAGFQPVGYGSTEEEATADLLEQQEDHDADDYDDSMDGDHDSAMASAGWGTDEDYGGGDDRY